MTRLLEIWVKLPGVLRPKRANDFPGNPWIEIIGLRNRLIHGLRSSRCDVLWSIVKDDLTPPSINWNGCSGPLDEVILCGNARTGR